MEWFKSLFEYFTDSSKAPSKRVSIIIVILILALLVDNHIGFTYYYNEKSKLETVAKMNQILEDSTLSIEEANLIKASRYSVIKRKNLLDKGVSNLKNFIESFRKSNSSTITQNNTTNDTTINKYSDKNIEKKSYRSNIVFFLSSSGLTVMLGFITIYVIFFMNQYTTVSQKISFAGIIGFIISLLSVSSYFLLGLIPQLLKNSYLLNYIVNIAVQIIVILLVFYMTKGTTKSRLK